MAVRGTRRGAAALLVATSAALAVSCAEPPPPPPAPATALVSVGIDGSVGNNVSSGVTDTAMSADGRFVAFHSAATNLAPGDAPGILDVFIRDLVAGTTEVVSVGADGSGANGGSSVPSISDDGRFVGFTSDASNLVAGDTNGRADAFVRDRLLDTTILVSPAPGGGNGFSRLTGLSADGTIASFNSSADNLVSGDTNGQYDVFVRNLLAATTERVSVGDGEEQGDSLSFGRISRNGSRVVFSSAATNLVTGDTNDTNDVFVRDLAGGTTTRVSVDSNGTQIEEPSRGGWISPDGLFVTFETAAPSVVPSDTDFAYDVFVSDLTTGVVDLASVNDDETGIPQSLEGGYVASGGRYVAFFSLYPLDPNDQNGSYDVYIRDRQAGTTRLISTATDGSAIGATAYIISDDARYIAFATVGVGDPVDDNFVPDVYRSGPLY